MKIKAAAMISSYILIVMLMFYILGNSMHGVF